MTHIYIGPNARFWTAYYNRCQGSLMDNIRWRYSCPCPGSIVDPRPAIGKFERWHRITRNISSTRIQKAAWLYWKYNPRVGT